VKAISRQDARVVVVGVGGLGSPAAIVLARGGVGTLVLCDDDEVAATNLHRQILFDASDVGRSKTVAAAERLRSWTPHPPSDTLRIETGAGRFLPENAAEILLGADLVVEGSDNFPTKFLVADACALAGVPVVHAGAVRWHGTALAVAAGGAPCYRCLFEDLPGPDDAAPNCAEAGVIGPMVGVVAALQADLALALLDGARDVAGVFVSFDGKTGDLRRRRISARPGCALCSRGDEAGDPRPVTRIERSRYLPTEPPSCSAD
jgi:molybdopterin/thiamine biosynthesis adenylyltransferase